MGTVVSKGVVMRFGIVPRHLQSLGEPRWCREFVAHA